MGCGPSKDVDESILVKLCRERKQLIKAAAEHRYALAAAHLCYLKSLKDIGESLDKFIAEELVLIEGSSEPDSPVLTLPSDEWKKRGNGKNSSSSTSISHSRNHSLGGEEEGSHLHLSSLSDSESELDPSHGQDHGGSWSNNVYYRKDVDGQGEGGYPPENNVYYRQDMDGQGQGGYPPENNVYYMQDMDGQGRGGSSPPENNVYYRQDMVEAPYYPPPYDPYATMGFWGPPAGSSRAYYMRKAPTEPLTVYKIPPRSVEKRLRRHLKRTSKRHVVVFDGGSLGSPCSGYENDLSDNASNSRKKPSRKSVALSIVTQGFTLNEAPKESPHGNSYLKFMRRTPASPNVGFQDPRGSASNSYWQESPNYFSNYPQYNNNAGYFGFLSGSAMQNEPNNSRMQHGHPTPPLEPPTANASGWDFMNIFNTWEQYEPSYYTKAKYASTSSSPDSKEVREREGIPDLEYETESENIKVVNKGKRVKEHEYPNFGEGTSRPAPSHYSDETFWTASSLHTGGTSKPMPAGYNQKKEEKRDSSESMLSKNSEEELVRKKGVTFEIHSSPRQEIESLRPSSAATLATHGTRDLQDAIKEIKEEFTTVSEVGKEVLSLLEVGTLPYQSRSAILKAQLYKILDLGASSKISSHSGQYVQMASRTMKMAKAFYGDPESDSNRKSRRLSFVLDELYIWEKKLYKEVKDEERLRVSYEKACKRLKAMDVQGAESTKVEAIQASMKKYLTKINVQIKSIESISSRINSLRDRELEPQLNELIQGLIQMWKLMLLSHQRQFQAIVESKHRTLKANIGLRRDSNLRATVELEMELVNWCSNFRSWIVSQKSYIKSLNDWLMKCLSQEQEETADGPVPFSPGRMEAPRVFIICNDWFQAMERVSENEVKRAMEEFAFMLHQLWERQDVEQRQRLRSEDLVKEYESRIKTYRMEKGRMEDEHETTMSQSTAGSSKVPSESKVSQLDDLKSDLDMMRKKLQQEKARHKESVKQIHNTASDSIQSGLVPIFEALKNFSSEALQAHEQVRLHPAESVS